MGATTNFVALLTQKKIYINRICMLDFEITTNNPFTISILTTHLDQLNVHNGVSMEIHHCVTPILCRVTYFGSNREISVVITLQYFGIMSDFI